MLALGLVALLAAPAFGQESPTPPSSPSPSPSPSPTAAAPAPAPAPDPQPETRERRQRPPSRKRDRRRRAERRPEARAEHRLERRRERRRQARRQCAPFSHTQVYTSWGPALSYGEAVTVVYSAERCTKPDGTTVVVTSEGTASVYQGTGGLGLGEQIDRRPFRLTGRWDRPTNEAGWPLAWWGCGVKLAEYRWEIPGVYVFDVRARWGAWSLDVSSLAIGPQSQPRDFHWSYSAC